MTEYCVCWVRYGCNGFRSFCSREAAEYFIRQERLTDATIYERVAA